MNRQELIQHNPLPEINSNEITYLLSENGKIISIKDGDQIKVISKDDFNGNFQTSPTV